MAALADPNDYVRELEVQQGEHEVDTFLGSASRTPSGAAAENAAGIGIGLGATSWLKTELAARYSSAGSHPWDAIEWDNVMRFAEQGEWPVDIGAVVEVERPRNSALGWSTALGPSLQYETGKWQLNANLLEFRISGGTNATPSHLGYQLQAKYREREHFEYGVQAFGTSAATSTSGGRSEASHRLGPAIFGRFKLPGSGNLRYNAGLLLGAAHGAPDRTLRAQLEFEF